MDYVATMKKAEEQAERGSTLHTVVEVFDVWQWEEESLPPDAEQQARELFALANENRRKEGHHPLDPDYVMKNLQWRHAQQCPGSPWKHLRNTPSPATNRAVP